MNKELKTFKIIYYDEIKAINEKECKDLLLSHLTRDVEYLDISCFKIEEMSNE
tara:strand:- start:1023 stop:1181 length:159 start_codon:yes stop_codon:yes gene_type:complete